MLLELASELPPFLRIHNDGTVERFYRPTYAPPSPAGAAVLSKDTIISPHVSARLYLPLQNLHNHTKLPILVYFHGGGFCIESAFSALSHRYVTTIASQANAIIVSVDYRLAPENPLPAAYDDSWTALQWVASHNSTKQTITPKDPWLTHHADFHRLHIGGDSSGANISHHLAIRSTLERLPGDVNIRGVFLSQPYFWGSKPLGSEPLHNRESTPLYKTWMIAYPGAKDGIDNPGINPFSETAPSLSRLGCRNLLVCVGSEDELRDRGIWYYEAVRKSGWRGESVQVFEADGAGHGFHVFDPECDKAKEMFNCLAEFLNK